MNLTYIIYQTVGGAKYICYISPSHITWPWVSCNKCPPSLPLLLYSWKKEWGYRPVVASACKRRVCVKGRKWWSCSVWWVDLCWMLVWEQVTWSLVDSKSYSTLGLMIINSSSYYMSLVIFLYLRNQFDEGEEYWNEVDVVWWLKLIHYTVSYCLQSCKARECLLACSLQHIKTYRWLLMWNLVSYVIIVIRSYFIWAFHEPNFQTNIFYLISSRFQ